MDVWESFPAQSVVRSLGSRRRRHQISMTAVAAVAAAAAAAEAAKSNGERKEEP